MHPHQKHQTTLKQKTTIRYESTKNSKSKSNTKEEKKPHHKKKVKVRETRMEKWNLFNRESEEAENNSGNKEKKESDPKKRTPCKSSHRRGKPETPTSALFVVVLAIWYCLLQRQASSQSSKICQISCRFLETKRKWTWRGFLFVFSDKVLISVIIIIIATAAAAIIINIKKNEKTLTNLTSPHRQISE